MSLRPLTKCKCKYCGTDMTIDDVDFNFEGNQDNYWQCEKCGASCFEKIRYNKSVSREFEKCETPHNVNK